MQEVKGTLERIAQSRANEDGTSWVCWRVRLPDGGQLSATGYVQGKGEEYAPGDALLLVGQLTTHQRWGETFKFKEALRQLPVGDDQVAAFITRCAHGKKLGVGPAMAGRLVAHYGEAALDALRDPGRACLDGLLDARQAEGLSEALRKESETLTADLQWHAVLDSIKGLPRRRAISSARKKGLRLDAVRADLYQLVLRKVAGCTFPRVDGPALTVGLPENGFAAAEASRRADLVHRHGLALWYELCRQVDQSGDVWLPPPAGIGVKVDGLPEGADASLDAQRGLNYLLDLKWLERDRGPEGIDFAKYVALQPLAEAERVVARRSLALLSAGPGVLSAVDLRNVSLHQLDAFRQIQGSRLALLTGGPGSGKTRTLAEIVKAVGPHRVALAAPTGKAAVRISEAMRAAGVDAKPARTLHSLLGIFPRDDEEVGTFEGEPIDAPLVAIDECSMVDVDLMARLLCSVPDSTTLLLIGDTGQLPPVGPGSPLRDLVNAGVPCARLTEVWRNSGAIVDACQTLAAGRKVPWVDLPPPDFCDDIANMAFVAADDSAAADVVLMDLLAPDGRLARLGYDPLMECQVLVATNATRRRLNHSLQALQNPGEGVWRIGDKVMITRNGEMSGGVRVANGDSGLVVKTESDNARIGLTCPDREVVCRIPAAGQEDDDSGSNKDDDKGRVTLAYAITGHRSQGSEWPVVVLVADQQSPVCSREWLYTAISRARKLCIVVGNPQLLDGWSRRVVLPRRRTKLCDLLMGG